jgi:O-acetyl-ADP-ribose deacetylase
VFILGYNLPAKFVIHTVGPIIQNVKKTLKSENILKNCYQNSLNLAIKNKIRTIVR